MRLRTTLFFIAGLAISALWYLFLVAPVHRTQARMQSELAMSQVQLEDYQATLNQFPVFLQTRDGINRKIAEINARLFSRQEILNLFDHVEQMAIDQQLRVSELAPHIEELLQLAQTPHTPGNPQVMSMDVKLTGDYLAFGRFMESLEEQAFFKKVDGCLISESPDHRGMLLFDLQFKALLETPVGQS